MSKPETDFIPINEVKSQKINVSIPFPEYLDVSKIGINVPRIQTLCQVGGLKHLSILGSSEEQTPFTGPAKNIITFDELDIRPHAAAWARGATNINMDWITREAEKNRTPTSDTQLTKAWSVNLDRIVRSEIANLGWKHLAKAEIKQTILDGEFLLAFFLGALATDFAFYLAGHKLNPQYDLLYALVILRAYKFGEADNRRGENGMRLSAFWDAEYDRAVALKLMSKFGKPVIKTLP